MRPKPCSIVIKQAHMCLIGNLRPLPLVSVYCPAGVRRPPSGYRSHLNPAVSVTTHHPRIASDFHQKSPHSSWESCTCGPLPLNLTRWPMWNRGILQRPIITWQKAAHLSSCLCYVTPLTSRARFASSTMIMHCQAMGCYLKRQHKTERSGKVCITSSDLSTM